jgi:Family of unknown function (DUF5636)
MTTPGDQWDARKNGVNITSKWGAVANLEWYQRIYDFLCDESEVSAHLEQLASRSHAASSGPTAIQKYLRKYIEKKNGFTGEVARLENLLTGDEFMKVIQAKRPILDLGVAPIHGALTHRIQWALCAMKFAPRLSGTLTMGDLYAGLAHLTARTGGSLWDDLVDHPPPSGSKAKWVYNAREPEFLMRYMKGHRDGGVRKLFEFSESLAKDFLTMPTAK